MTKREVLKIISEKFDREGSPRDWAEDVYFNKVEPLEKVVDELSSRNYALESELGSMKERLDDLESMIDELKGV